MLHRGEPERLAQFAHVRAAWRNTDCRSRAQRINIEARAIARAAGTRPAVTQTQRDGAIRLARHAPDCAPDCMRR